MAATKLCVIPLHRSAALVLFYLSMTHAAQMRYLNSYLTNPGLASPITASSESVCVSTCNATVGCSAVSYSSNTQQCVLSFCANLKVSTNNSWVTVTLDMLLREGCDVPAARYEWMLTDKCGNSSSGYLAGVPDMVGQLSAVGLPSASVFMGRAYIGNDTGKSSCWNAKSNGMLGFNFTASYSYFAYIYVTANGIWFPIFEFDYYDAAFTRRSSLGPHFWLFSDGLYYNVGVSVDTLSCTGSCTGSTAYAPTVNTWIPVAMVYDSVANNVTIYANNIQMAIFNVGSAKIRSTSSTLKCNFATSGCRDTFVIPGSIYCLKFFDTILSASQVQNLAKSCTAGKIGTS